MVVVDLAFERRVNDCYESVLTVDSCSMSTRKQHSHDDLTENDDRYSSHWLVKLVDCMLVVLNYLLC